MRIYIGNNNHVVIRRMRPTLNSMGHELIMESPKKCDIYLSFVRIDTSVKLPTVLRLDGIYYDLDTDYNKRNKSISFSHSVADGIIYQSNYSRMLCEKFLRPRSTKIFDVVHNGIQRFWNGTPLKHERINVVVSAKWRRHKRLKETIEIFLEFLRYYPNAMLHILGKLHNNKKIQHSNINYYGMIDRKKMKSILQIADMSISISKRDSCPNSVVEMIGAGIPVITTNKCGGATEMCKLTKNCFVVHEEEKNIFNQCRSYSDEWNQIPDPAKNYIIKSMKKIADQNLRCQLPDQLTIEYMTKRYIQICQKVLDRR